MSNATLVVRQYETASELSERFGCALLDLLRTWRHLPGADDVSADDLDRARNTALAVVSSIERALNGNSGDTARHQNDTALPEGFAAWFKALHQGDAVRAHDITRLRGHLAQVPAQCDDADIAILERVSKVLGAQTAHLFSRLAAEAERR